MDGGSNPVWSSNAPPPFLSKAYEMVDDPLTDSIVSWSHTSNSNNFVIRDPAEFTKTLLPIYFKHSNFPSFIKQLNTYGFRKVAPDRWEFANKGFLRGQKHLLKTIIRQKPTPTDEHIQPQLLQDTKASVRACVEVGKFGLEEEIERLKRDKNVLMQELLRLRQQQQATDHRLQSVGQGLQQMERRQQQMMSFLAKATRSPGFLAHLVQQNDTNRHITGANKKRRLPKQGISDGERAFDSDGQITNYQPLMNEAAKTMSMKMLKINNIPSPSERLDSGSSSSQIFGVTHAEVSPTPGHPYLHVANDSHPSSAVSEIQSPVATDMEVRSQFPNTNVLSTVLKHLTPSPANMVISELPRMQGMVPESIVVDIPNESFVLPKAVGNGIISPMSAGVDEAIPMEDDKFFSDTDIDILIDGMPRLPGINGSFWEQFLSSCLLSEDM